MLSARDIRVTRARKNVLDGVTIEVAPRAVTALVGPNGAGKSTLLSVLSGELTPDAGTVTMNGVALEASGTRDRARYRSVLSQATTLAFSLPVLDVVLLGRIPHNGGAESVEDRRIALAALAAVDCVRFAERAYESLSGGEQRRVQLARVVAQLHSAADVPPRYLLLDEPTAALDMKHQHACLELACALAEDNIGVLAVLHDLNLAARYAGRIVMLDRGATVADGEPARVLTVDSIRRTFGVTARVSAHPDTGRPVVYTESETATAPSGAPLLTHGVENGRPSAELTILARERDARGRT